MPGKGRAGSPLPSTTDALQKLLTVGGGLAVQRDWAEAKSTCAAGIKMR
jgi:hypothetical protein